jgi:superfamily II DNA/RNA helicase
MTLICFSQSITDMQTGNAKILVATDVAARGIDIINISYIINHGFASSIEQYVHRIGRTGRAGKQGESYTLFGYNDRANAKQLIEVLEHANQEVPQELRDLAEKYRNQRPQGSFRGGRGGGHGGGHRYDRQQGGFDNHQQSGREDWDRNTHSHSGWDTHSDRRTGRGNWEKRGFRSNDY